MEIVTTRPELDALIGSNTVGYTVFGRKQDASTFHEGHQHVLNYSKSNFDLTVAAFWDGQEFINEFYPLHDYWNINPAWDRAGTITWCENNGVDIVIAPEAGYAAEYLESLGVDTPTKNYLLDWVEQLWIDNDYPGISIDQDFSTINGNDMSRVSTAMRIRTTVIMQNIKQQKSTFTHVSSWKDGEGRFIIEHFINNFTIENYVMLDPIKNNFGSYYSTSHINYGTRELNILNEIEGVVNSVGYSDEETLIAALNALDTTGTAGFNVRRLDITEGGVVGQSNDFIQVQFDMGPTSSFFPIYKKGVR
jgi:hypothetical protein